MIKLGSLLSILLSAQAAFAATAASTAPAVSDISNVSAKSLTGGAKIWGGVAGDVGYCDRTQNAPCNSCSSMASAAPGSPCDPALTGAADPKTPFCACNENRIYDDLMVTIYLKDSGVEPVIIKAGQTTDLTEQNDGGKGSNFVQISWKKICQLIGDSGSATCEGLAAPRSGTLQIWVNKNNDNKVDADETTSLTVEVIPNSNHHMVDPTQDDGVSDYTTYPGDEKIFIENMTLPSGASVKSITVWFSELGFNKANYIDGNFQNFELDSQGNISIPRVTGLTNGTTYHFRTTISDAANNISGWTSNAYVSGNNCATTGVVLNPGPAGTPPRCTLAGKPDQVLGLLAEDMNCFIATAAYGSSLEPKLQVFRKFRQMILLPTDWGRRLVYSYYDIGPRAARWIQDKPHAREAARAALWPAYGFALLALRWGLPLALSVYVFLPLLLLTLLMIVFRKRMGRAKN